MNVILELPYAPSLPWMFMYINSDFVFIEKQENFIKSSYRNRCEISGPNGLLSLSIPIVGGKDHHQLYKNVIMSDTFDWRKNHFQSLASSYRRSPYFEYYEEKIYDLINQPTNNLYEYNSFLFDWILSVFNLNSKHTYTEYYVSSKEDFFDFRKFFKPSDSFKTQPANYSPPLYIQVFSDRNGFLPNLSILDYLFNEGPDKRKLLSNLSKY